MFHYYKKIFTILIIITFPLLSLAEESANNIKLDEVIVEGQASRLEAEILSPTAAVTSKDMELFNVPNVEDTFKYMPNMNVRKRYIGDPNGVLQIRGINSWQNGRSMVFADGLPIHYHLRSRWDGAPRWNAISPNEVEVTEVVYGPFQAEYSGSAMGGVVNFKTKFPDDREINLKSNAFLQTFDYYGTNDDYFGFKNQLSYGDRKGNFKYFFLVDQLKNDGHPQSFRTDTGAFQVTTTEPAITGAFRDQDPRNRDQMVYGDTGKEEVESNLFKMKLGYDFSKTWELQSTLARIGFERDQSNPNNYLRDATGQRIWGDGSNATDDAGFNGEAFNVRNDSFAVSYDDREEYLYGLTLNGEWGEGWSQVLTLSWYDIYKNEGVISNFNPSDPLDDHSGAISDLDGSKWRNLDFKINKEALFGIPDLNFHTGLHWSDYVYRSKIYDSLDWKNNQRDTLDQEDKGDIQTSAMFIQTDWRFIETWKVSLGGRYERWEMTNGFQARNNTIINSPDRDVKKFSPKFSLLFDKYTSWNLRYSAAKAYRFPISEELFGNYQTLRNTVNADPNLRPENGMHHSLAFQSFFKDAVFKINLFYDKVKDTIFSQTDVNLNTTTFLNIDEVTTSGIEFSYEKYNFLTPDLDLNLNLSYQDSEINKNTPNPSVEGNTFPRSPHWRSNALVAYHIKTNWTSSLGIRYSSNQFNRLENDDHGKGWGAIDPFFIVDTKMSYVFEKGFTLAGGVDNLFNEKAFVAHPYPQRTFFVEGQWKH